MLTININGRDLEVTQELADLLGVTLEELTADANSTDED